VFATKTTRHLTLLASFASMVTFTSCKREKPAAIQTDAGVVSDIPETRIHVRVIDSMTRKPVPSIVSLLDDAGNPIAFGNLTDRPGWAQGQSAGEVAEGALGFAHGMILWRGEATLPIGKIYRFPDPFQRSTVEMTLPMRVYRARISRGPEYNLVETVIDGRPGQGNVMIEIPITRTVNTGGYLAADFHVHSAPVSPDAGGRLRDILRLAAGSGVELVGLTEHDGFDDVEGALAPLWPRTERPLSTITGVELGGPAGAHFTVMFPDGPSPEGLAAIRSIPTEPIAGWMKGIRGLPSRPLLGMVHPRLGYGSYLDTPLCGAWAQRDRTVAPICPQAYDTFEVLSGWDLCSAHIHWALDDWYALLNLGIVTTGVSGSDSHYLTGMQVGMPRTYLATNDDGVSHVVGRDVLVALRNRRTVLTTGPFATLVIGESSEGERLTPAKEPVKAVIRVQAANWVDVTRVRFLQDGKAIREWTIDRKPMIEFDETFEHLIVPGALTKDAFFNVEVDGQQPLVSHLAGVYPYLTGYGLEKCPPLPGQPPGAVPFAVTAPIFVDADRDGRFKGAALGGL
jgi:hypothetical protein